MGRERERMMTSGPMVGLGLGLIAQSHGSERRESMNRLTQIEGDQS
ncbi:ArsR family toxin-antitoxin system [Cutibacterium avidum ATCC 25577]|uniref:ArsR family toxin-antitoxin system n=1 Tax=Cutibacterium avidum ATCC 25577 TaxID=997355 RepID=G4CVW3_9ACTN|nr:ArsR family toxin-antitoxin system [Cutibacterium avidum ATCC 25577]